MKWFRVHALVRRYLFLYVRSPTRWLEMLFAPTMELLVWGFLSSYLMRLSRPMPSSVIFLLGSAILWSVLNRSQLAVSTTFLEDVWTRNLMNLFASPLLVSEFLCALALVGLVRILITLLLLGLIAATCYGYPVAGLGWSLLPLFVNLVWLGWTLGMVAIALVLRLGPGAQGVAWFIPFLLQPLSAVFYPVSTLPAWAQPLAWMLPSTHVFEGMRQVLGGQGDAMPRLLSAGALNVVFFFLACALFGHMYQEARSRGLLARLGTQ